MYHVWNSLCACRRSLLDEVSFPQRFKHKWSPLDLVVETTTSVTNNRLMSCYCVCDTRFCGIPTVILLRNFVLWGQSSDASSLLLLVVDQPAFCYEKSKTIYKIPRIFRVVACMHIQENGNGQISVHICPSPGTAKRREGRNEASNDKPSLESDCDVLKF